MKRPKEIDTAIEVLESLIKDNKAKVIFSEKGPHVPQIEFNELIKYIEKLEKGF